MDYQVPQLSIVFMGVSALFGLALPVLLFLFLRKRYKADVGAFFIGCAVFVVFALMLEALAHQLILFSDAGEKIRTNMWLYGLYGGLMAGLFEETGRYLAFRTVLKKKRGKNENALMYGAGHGGVEVFYILCIGMITNIVLSVKLNAGMADEMLLALQGNAALAQMTAAFETLATTPSATYLAGIVERLAAVALHLSFSVLVWFAAKEKRLFWLYPLALLLHAGVDFAAVVIAGSVTNVWVIEGAICILTACCALIALCVWKKHSRREAGGLSKNARTENE